MNRTRQIYYHAVFGAIGGLLAWQMVGIFATGAWPLTAANAFIGAGAGFFIGLMLGVANGFANKLPLRATLLGALRGGAVGFVSGAVGMLIGGLLFVISGGGLQGRLLGWVLLGLLLGLGNGLVARSPLRAAYGAIGGIIAGGIGGLLYELMTRIVVRQGAADATGMDNAQMIMSALGLILIGACLGALIPMTLTILAQGRLRVLSGPRSGLEVDVLDSVTLGSYDGCAVYLPGDKAIARKHARVYRQDRRFFVTDLNAPGGTKVNGTLLAPGGAVPIAKGATIQLGHAVVELL